jgi:hypothetical protein
VKIHPVGAELFHADGRTDRQTDMTKLISAFRNFTKTPKIQINVALHFILNALFHVMFSARVTAVHAVL